MISPFLHSGANISVGTYLFSIVYFFIDTPPPLCFMFLSLTVCLVYLCLFLSFSVILSHFSNLCLGVSLMLEDTAMPKSIAMTEERRSYCCVMCIKYDICFIGIFTLWLHSLISAQF